MSAPLYKANALLLAKLETTYGTDPTPTAADNAMLVRDMSINPVEGNSIDLNYQKGYFGSSKALRATHYMTCQFSTDWMPSASLVVGSASPLDPLWRACGLSNTSFSQATGTAQSASNRVSGTAQTQATPNKLFIQLAAGTTQADDFFNGAIIRITGGTGAGQERVIKDWTLSTKMAEVTTAWSITPNSTSTYEILPFIKLTSGSSNIHNAYAGMSIVAAGNGARIITAYAPTNKVATINSNWDVVPTTAAYTIRSALNYDPVSSNHESVTLYYNVGGVRHKLLGCRGTASLTLSANELPGVTYNMTGLYGGLADVSEDAPSYAAFAEPLTINSTNTRGLLFGRDFSGSSTNLQLQKFSLDLGNNVAYRALVGSESVIISDRQVKGSLTLEMTNIATMDWMSLIRTSSTGRLYLENGVSDGLTVALNLPAIQIESLSYSDSDGIVMADMNFRAVSVNGNDDIRLIEK